MQTIAERLAILPQVGRLEWIGLSPGSGQPLQVVESANLLAGFGIEGDYHSKRRAGAKRQVTLIQQEHLSAVASFLHSEPLDPRILRRNLVVSGLNLLALKQREFLIGECRLIYTGPCDPCSKMERELGTGAYNALRGHGVLRHVPKDASRVDGDGANRRRPPTRSRVAEPGQAEGCLEGHQAGGRRRGRDPACAGRR